MTATLLVELFCEELPPRALRRLGEAFARALHAALARREFAPADGAMRMFATPRRLAVAIDDVPDLSQPRAAEVKLMPATVGLDASGKPTAALLKKLQAAGLSHLEVAQLKRRTDGKSEMLFAEATTPAVPLAQALQGALDEAIEGLPIPKVMGYQLADGRTTVRFVRPVHGLVALHGGEVVTVGALGLEAGRRVHGHRFQGAGEIDLAAAGEYERRLEAEGNVVADFDRRRMLILDALQAAAAKERASLGPEADYLPLLDEVTALVEMPSVYVGRFDEDFLAVPAEVLVLTMRQNQKYFPLFEGAKLTSRFLIVSNMRLEDPANIVRGNERVVRPRLADARFFFETDKKERLEARVPQLAAIVHHNKIGTQRDRVDRLVMLAQDIQKVLPRGESGIEWAVRAAYLAKADLVTLMVGEFPELQGLMGRYYAEADGEPPSVCRAIEQHYWPRFAGDALPTGDASIAVALADRLDALIGMFAIGQVPTGDKDPFALRRAALGIVRILMETTPALKADLGQLLFAAAARFNVPREAQAALVDNVREFVRERLANLMRERGYSAHEVAAVLEVQSEESRPDRLDLVPAKLEAVRAFGKLPEAASLTAANKRISNILRQAQQKGEPYEILRDSFEGEPLETELHAALRQASSAAKPQFEGGDYTGYLRSFAILKAPVDAFFDKVMVMAEDPAVRRRRLSLLHTLQAEMNRVADIARLAA
ncbi:MAG TPA: glycine--tRNA ligase subunit beta [Usitatibacter sp.]|nr:glycine--tRNA ligase subunit beta [Usitatibacter sp.]